MPRDGRDRQRGALSRGAAVPLGGRGSPGAAVRCFTAYVGGEGREVAASRRGGSCVCVSAGGDEGAAAPAPCLGWKDVADVLHPEAARPQQCPELRVSRLRPWAAAAGGVTQPTRGALWPLPAQPC